MHKPFPPPVSLDLFLLPCPQTGMALCLRPTWTPYPLLPLPSPSVSLLPCEGESPLPPDYLDSPSAAKLGPPDCAVTGATTTPAGEAVATPWRLPAHKSLLAGEGGAGDPWLGGGGNPWRLPAHKSETGG